MRSSKRGTLITLRLGNIDNLFPPEACIRFLSDLGRKGEEWN